MRIKIKCHVMGKGLYESIMIFSNIWLILSVMPIFLLKIHLILSKI